MTRRWIGQWVVAAGFALAAMQPARASLLLSDDFESGLISGAIWATNLTGSLVADPLASGHGFVLHFGGFGGGGDLFSGFLPLSDPIYLEFDFLQVGTTNSGAYVGTDHQTTPWGDEQWILNTGGSGAYPNLDFLSAGAWHHVSLAFSVLNNFAASTFTVKFEQANAGSGPGNAYFDNIVVSNTPIPEPGTLTCLLLGLGGIAVRILRKRPR